MAVDFKGYEKALDHLKKYYDANPDAPYTGLNLLQGSNVFFRVSDSDPDVCLEKIIPVLKELEESESTTQYKLALMRKNEKGKEEKAIAVSFYVIERPEKSAATVGNYPSNGEAYYYKAKCEELVEKVSELKEKNKQLQEELEELETQHNELLETVEKQEESMVGAIQKQVVDNLPAVLNFFQQVITKPTAPAQAPVQNAINGIPDDTNVQKYLDILFKAGLTEDHIKKLAEMAQNNPGKFKGLLFML